MKQDKMNQDRNQNKEKKPKKSRKKAVILCGTVLLLLIAGGGGCYVFRQMQGKQEGQGERPMPRQIGEVSCVTASGTTSIGITEESFDLEELDTELAIEEVYLSAGDTVEQGTKILKISEKSMEQARTELTRKATQAQLRYNQAVIENELSQIEAQRNYDVTMVEAEYVESDYQNSLETAKQDVEELTEQLEDAKELYEEYYDGVNNDAYREEYELEEKKALYEQNEKLYWDTLKDWNIKDSEVNNTNTSNSGGNSPGGGPSGGSQGGNSAAAADKQQRITALELMEDIYRAEKEEYEQALKDYHKAVEKATAGLEQAKAEYELLELELRQAQIDYEKQAAVCQADYETKLAEIENAQNIYDTAVQKLQDELDTLLNDKEEAEENLQVFEETVGDGYLYTSSKGNVVMISVSAGDELEPDSIVLAYSDPTILTVTAAVDQADIAKIEIGETAVVVSEEEGSYEAQVTEISPISNSQSRTSVTYAVTLCFPGENLQKEAEKLSENETVTVCFGITLEEYRKKIGGGV